MTAGALSRTWKRITRSPLGWALAASLILHTAAAAGFHFLFQPLAPEPLAPRTIALVTLAQMPAKPQARIEPTPRPKPAPPLHRVRTQEPARTPMPQVLPLAKPITPDPRSAAIPVFKAPPRRPAAPAPSHHASAPPAPKQPIQNKVATLPALHPPGYGQPDLANARPRYPWLSRQKGEQGRVVLRVSVDATGRAAAVTVAQSSGFGRLDRAAKRAVETWRFTPARRGGRALAGSVDVPVSFRLSDG